MTSTATRSMRRPPRGGRRTRRYLLVVVIIIALLVVLDFASRAVAENIMATQIQKQGLPKKPDVSIGGFPFLTQVAAKNFQQVTISTTNLPEGPVTLTKVNVTATWHPAAVLLLSQRHHLQPLWHRAHQLCLAG